MSSSEVCIQFKGMSRVEMMSNNENSGQLEIHAETTSSVSSNAAKADILSNRRHENPEIQGDPEHTFLRGGNQGAEQ